MNPDLHATFVRRFPGGPSLRVDSLQLDGAGGVTVLFGPSGAGKSTVLRCLAGIERPDEGVIRFGREVWSDAAERLFLPARQRRVGFVPQDYGLFPHLSVAANIGFGLNRLAAPERQRRIAQALKWVGLEGLERRRPHQLSGGEQQRVALARAVVTQPRLLLLDEPLAALDAPNRLRLRAELRGMLLELAIPTLLVTHDRTEALALGDELLVMEGGQIIQRGPVSEVFRRPATLGVAGALAVETIEPGEVLERGEGVVTVVVRDTRLIAVDPGLPAGIRRVLVCVRADEVLLAEPGEHRSSVRNALPGVVRALLPEDPVVRVTLDCGFPLIAFVTRPGCEAMGLREGLKVVALVKASSLHLIPHPGLASGRHEETR